MLKVDESGLKGIGVFFDYSYNFSVNVKLFPNKKLKENWWIDHLF